MYDFKQKITISVLALSVIIFLISGCGKSIPIKTEVNAAPGDATVIYKGKQVGKAPLTINVSQLSDLTKITAQIPQREIIETRVRILSEERAEVYFRFGTEPSPLAKALGLKKVLVFDYSENATFDTDKYVLKTEFKPFLLKQAELLNKYFSTLPVYVCGHTDDVGTDEYNLQLSLTRAQTVADFLKANNVKQNRIKVQGFGETYPIAAGKEQRARNRRTEILLPQ